MTSAAVGSIWLKRFKRVCVRAAIVLTTVELALQALGLAYRQFDRSRLLKLLADNGEAKTILCIGDSHTWGVGAGGLDKSYPSALQQLFHSAGSVRKIRVINEGVPGQNSSQLLKRLESQIQRYRPDIVIVMVGTNNRWNFLDFSIPAASAADRVARLLSSLKVCRVLFLFVEALRQPRGERALQQPSFDAPLGEGWTLFSKGEFEQARRLFESASRLQPENLGPHRGLGMCLFRTNDIEGAIKELCFCVRLDPYYVPAYVELGDIYVTLQKFDLAIELLRQAIAYEPHNAWAHRLFARALNRRFFAQTPEEQARLQDNERAKQELAAAFGFDHDFNATVLELHHCYPQDAPQFLRDFRSLLFQANYRPSAQQQKWLGKYEAALRAGDALQEPALAVGNSVLEYDLKRIAQMCWDHKINPWFMTYAADFAQNDSIRRAARQSGIPLIDLEEAFRISRRQRKSTYFNSDWHPNAAGYALMARLIYEAIADADTGHEQRWVSAN